MKQVRFTPGERKWLHSNSDPHTCGSPAEYAIIPNPNIGIENILVLPILTPAVAPIEIIDLTFPETIDLTSEISSFPEVANVSCCFLCKQSINKPYLPTLVN